MQKDSMLSFRINSEILEAFKAEAEKRGMSQSDLFLEYQAAYKKDMLVYNPYYRTHELFKFVNAQIADFQHLEQFPGSTEGDSPLLTPELQEYVSFLRDELWDRIRQLPTYWERRYKEDEFGDYMKDYHGNFIPDEEGNQKPW